MKQNITILGSTGSIGTSTPSTYCLNHLDRFQVFALTASKQVDVILAQCAKFKPKFAVMAQEDAGRLLAERIKAEGLSVEVSLGV
jgi:1-deoxy-D-xylulose-5-phosphate reductoisomerase